MSKNYLFNPQAFTGDNLEEKTRKLIKSNIDYWENKGLRAIKQGEMERSYDFKWVEYQKEQQVLATLFTPSGYGAKDSRFDLRRLTEYNESLAFYNASARYMWQASLIGSAPVWLSNNEAMKHRVAKYLQEGFLFGFGCSEKTHGADLYATETMVSPLGDGKYIMNGEKYYIGNSNVGFMSNLCKFKDSKEFGFVLSDSRSRHYNDKKQIHCSYMPNSYVGEYYLVDYPITDEDIISRGEKAWQDAFSTVNLGKFQIGVSSSGIATHAFYECLRHSYNRWIYGARVTDMPHIRRFYVEAYLRTVGMRLYSFRTIDYFKNCSETDRRYLLYNPVSKMKTPQEGRDIINLLWDAVAARGFEVETYMESATRDVQAASKLEGTAHVNLSLILKFIKSYLLNPTEYPELGILKNNDDSGIYQQQTHGSLSSIRFDDYKKALNSRRLPNIEVFAKQALVLEKLFGACPPSKEATNNKDYMLNLGFLFTMVPYAQLIVEASNLYDVADEVVNQMFAYYVTDMAKYAVIQLYSQQNTPQIEECLREILSYQPIYDDKEYDKLWTETIAPLESVYIQNQ